MVFKKTTNHRSNGFNVPNIPRAPRSCRRNSQFKRTVDNSHFCAFELLASLAGKLLQESVSSSTSTNAVEGDNQSDIGKEVKQEQHDECKPLEAEYTDSKSTNENITGKCVLNEFPLFEHDDILERTPISGCFGNMNQDLNTIESEKQKGSNFSTKTVGVCMGESGGVPVNLGLKQQEEEKTEGTHNADLIAATMRRSEGATDLHINFTNLPTLRVPVPNSSFARNRNHIKLGCRDDDEKFYKYYVCSKKSKSYRHPTSVREWRLKKLLSKNWKAAPQLKDFEYSRPDGGHKQLYRKRKTSYGYQYHRRQLDSVCKRRKISNSSSIVTSDGGLSSESVSYSPEKGKAVKFSIKSFKVPELYIDVPETTTVGSLKRTVLEAVTALLGGGIRVGLRVRGKKVRDDNKTLIQTGISCKETLDTLGFTLEPGLEKASPTLCTESDDPLSLPPDATQFPKCSPVSPFLGSGDPISHPDSLSLINAADNVDSNRQLVAYKTEISINEPSDSKALVPVPALNVKALAMIPVNQKAKRSELAQRRTRRPFSVLEVEALVQAVEDVGTGRWRDVKLRAFENADHRTYVDLKDKWKTLVHTASIAPQQRRGAPVPQELLDRVLAAHSYWTQHQAKQQDKHQTGYEDANRVGATSIQAG